MTYTLSRYDALPLCCRRRSCANPGAARPGIGARVRRSRAPPLTRSASLGDEVVQDEADHRDDQRPHECGPEAVDPNPSPILPAIQLVRSSMRAFITKVNSPSVRIVIGRVKSITIGRMITL